MTTLYLVRHAQSEANANHLVLRKNTNIGITLTDIGKTQTQQCAEFLFSHFMDKSVDFPSIFKEKNARIKIWNSPYERTRSTAQAIKKYFDEQNLLYEEEENIHISERQLGLVDEMEDYEKNYKYEFEHYRLHCASQHEYFVRPPLGESSFDLSLRLDFFLKNYIEKEPHYEHIVITHGACVRGLTMLYSKEKYEYYLKMKNPPNCSIHLLSQNNDKGMLFCPTNMTGI